MSFWIALLLLTLLTIYLIKHPPKEEEAPEQAPPKIKITVSKRNDSALVNLPSSPSSNSGSKAVRVAEKEIEEWLRKNPSLRDANKL